MELHALVLLLGVALGDSAAAPPDPARGTPLDSAQGKQDPAATPADPGPGEADQSSASAGVTKQEQEPKPLDPLFQEPGRRPVKLKDDELPWVDFDWLEIQPRVGLALFTDDFRIGPTPFLSVLAHVPLPLLSPGSSPEGEYFGLFAEAIFVPRVQRDLDPAPDHSSGSLLFMTLGMDYAVLRDQSVYLAVQVGVQYGWYGGITDLKDGIAPVAGLIGGLHLGKGLTLTLGSEVVLGHVGNRIYLNSAGLLIEF